jgi:excisionase family DNA binding protein
MTKLLTVRELALSLGCHPVTVYRLLKKGGIPFIKKKGIGIRFRKADVDTWLDKGSCGILASAGLAHHVSFLTLPHGGVRTIAEGGSELAKAKSKTRWNFGCGAVYLRKFKGNLTRFCIDFRDACGERVQRVIPEAQTLEDARDVLLKKVEKVLASRYGLKKPIERISLKEFSDTYLTDYAKINKRSWRTDRGYLRIMAESDSFRGLFLDEITSREIEKFKAERRERDEVTPATVNRCLAILRRMLNLAVEWGYLEKGQVPKIKLFREDNLMERILSPEEEARLLRCSSTHLRSILITALNSGMRLGEILGLTWNRIDIAAGTIAVTKTKSGKDRVLPVNLVLRDELQRLHAENGLSPYVFVNPRTKKRLGCVKTTFRASCRRAGIEGFRFHDARHTFASRLVAKGADVATVRDLLGHSSLRVTERYIHSAQEQKRKAVELLEDPQEKPEDLLRAGDAESAPRKSMPVSPSLSIH